jgi:N-acetylmuramoyl-L-alanine amidase
MNFTKNKIIGNYSYILFWIIIVNFLLMFQIVSGQELTVVYSNDPYASAVVRTISDNNIRYVSIQDIANLFNARTYFSEQNKKLVVYLDDNILKISAFNPFILIDQQVYQLPIETIFLKGEIFVSLNYFLEIIDRILPNKIIYNKWNNQLEIITPSYHNASNIENIGIEEKVNGTLINIATSQDFSESDLGLRFGHDWIYVDIYGGKADSSALYAAYNTGLVAEVVPSQVSDELAQIGFRLRDKAVEKQLILKNPNEILVSIKTKKDLSTDITGNLEREKRRWRIDRIIIDPGHGGKDPGAIGKYGTKEKDVVLAISHYLKELLEDELGIEVLMTREDDRFLELSQRTEFANRNQAKLFISIHANSNRNRRVNGVSTYFLGPENTEEAREVANLENSVIKLENESRYVDLSQENYILSAMAQNIYNKESQDLADIVQREVSRECNLRDIGVKQAGFYVLWGASMPNILIETAFISNNNEERLLRSSSFQKKQALAIYQSIKKFKKRYESQL